MDENKQVHIANQHIRAVLDACDAEGVELHSVGLFVPFGADPPNTCIQAHMRSIELYVYFPITAPDTTPQSTYDKTIQAIDHWRNPEGDAS